MTEQWKAKKYLLRAPYAPYDPPSVLEVISQDLIWGNAGNILFSQSVFRALLTDEDTVIDCIKIQCEYGEEDIRRFNEEYDALIIPLANAFRKSFSRELYWMTLLIRKLTIPVIVIGVGYQGGLSADPGEKHDWDSDVKNFCKAVLDHSASMGIRGEITASYLKTLGFAEERDFAVIGCPSLFMYGDTLPSPKPLEISADTRISLNSTVTLKSAFHRYMGKVTKEFPDYIYIPQNTYELKTLFCGLDLAVSCPYIKKVPEAYIGNPNGTAYREDRVRGFYTAESWLSFLKGRDLTFGSRIHGNIAGILAGIPSFIIAPDTRVLELAEYHHIPHIPLSQLNMEAPATALLEKADFSTILDGHRERFEKYHAFLRENGLATIYDDDASRNTCIFDRLMEGCPEASPIVPFMHAEESGRIDAVKYWNEMLREAEKSRPLQSISDMVSEKQLSFSNILHECVGVAKYLFRKKKK